MRVTKRIEEYIREQVNEKFEQKLEELRNTTGRRRKEIEKACEEAKRKVYPVFEKLMTEEEFDCKIEVEFHSYRGDYLKKTPEEEAAENKIIALNDKRAKTIQDILIALELGGTKEELDRMLANINTEVE